MQQTNKRNNRANNAVGDPWLCGDEPQQCSWTLCNGDLQHWLSCSIRAACGWNTNLWRNYRKMWMCIWVHICPNICHIFTSICQCMQVGHCALAHCSIGCCKRRAACRWNTYIRVSHENMFFKKKMAQPAPQVFGGCFEGIQKDFLFWQVLRGAQARWKWRVSQLWHKGTCSNSAKLCSCSCEDNLTKYWVLATGSYHLTRHLPTDWSVGACFESARLCNCFWEGNLNNMCVCVQ